MKINKILNQDVFVGLSKFKSNFFDLIIADPPYNQINEKWDIFEDDHDFFRFTYDWIDLTIDKLKDGGSIYIFNNQFNSIIISNYLISKGLVFQNWIVWNKKDGFSYSKNKFVSNQEVILFFTKGKEHTFNSDDVRTPYESSERMEHAKKKGILKNGKRWYPNEKGKLCTDVWNFSSVRHNQKIKGKTNKTFHPTPKPYEMMERIVKASSNKGDLILDLFAGTGTTSLAALKNERNFIAIENNKKYVNFIKKRLKEFYV